MAIEALRVIEAPIAAAPSIRSLIDGYIFASHRSPYRINGCSPIERVCSQGIVTDHLTSVAISNLAVPEPLSSLRPKLAHVEDIYHGSEES